MNLSAVFTEVVHKQLVAVDLLNKGSHQHELNGSNALKGFFGTSGKIQGKLSWYYFNDDEETIQQENDFTFYDARERSFKRTGRSEWRLYYYGDFISNAEVGDSLFLAKTKSGHLLAMLFREGSAWLRAAEALFGTDAPKPELHLIDRQALDKKRLELLQKQILIELGLESSLPVDQNDEELMLSRFGHKFPNTQTMSHFAREHSCADISQPDEALVCWLEKEEALFRALENVEIQARLKKGFHDSEDFINYSLSVQNRRKSRMGFALQNHLSEIFTLYHLRFTAQALTEAANKPDFIFPGYKEYHDATYDAGLLVMLGVKSTCKDRWRQVLTEAEKIPKKHLCTLEAGISTKQTDEMFRQGLTLVVPKRLHKTYTALQLEALLSVEEFIHFIQYKQVATH